MTDRCAAEAAGPPSAGRRPAEGSVWKAGRGEVRSDLEEGQRRAQIGEGGAAVSRSGCGEVPGVQGEESHGHYIG